MPAFTNIMDALDDFLYPAAGAVPTANAAALKTYVDAGEGKAYRNDANTDRLPSSLTRADCPALWSWPVDSPGEFTTNVFTECDFTIEIWGALYTTSWRDLVSFYEKVQAAVFSGFPNFYVAAAGDYAGHAAVSGLKTFNLRRPRWASLEDENGTETFRVFAVDLLCLVQQNPRGL